MLHRGHTTLRQPAGAFEGKKATMARPITPRNRPSAAGPPALRFLWRAIRTARTEQTAPMARAIGITLSEFTSQDLPQRQPANHRGGALTLELRAVGVLVCLPIVFGLRTESCQVSAPISQRRNNWQVNDEPDGVSMERSGEVQPPTLGSVGDHDHLRERRLIAVLRQSLGIDGVLPVIRPAIGGVVMLDSAIGTTTTQRLCLQQQGDTLILRTWLAELKPQAKSFYQTARAQSLTRFLSEPKAVWHARANVHLAFRNAAGPLRLYPHCRLQATEYIQRWSGDDFAWVGAHPRQELRSKLWPWLRSRQYAGPEDDEQVNAFLDRLGRRDVHLRPSLELTRFWPWGEAVELDGRGALTGDVRSAVASLLSALGESLPPGCVVTPEGS